MRRAVREWLGRYAPAGVVAVALSGGADSVALTAAACAEADVVDALIVDHGLQAGSAEVAAEAAALAMRLGCRSARVLPVSVGSDGGLEAAARRARYAALDEARQGLPVLLGHTLDDQAETVLLGLARGSGGRSIRGMAEFDQPWGRPLLGVRRGVPRELCADLGIVPWEDPHNGAPEFTRVRVRNEVLPLLEEVLGGGVAGALARTAAQLREDGEVLDGLAEEWLADAREGDALRIETLATAAAAVRRRVIRAWLLGHGAKSLTDSNLRAVDALVTRWRGQGGVAVGGSPSGTRLVAAREHGRLILRSE
ncbi:tRNA lysidine(34) synthetase TilS [Nocardia seriolae]|nr:tRNA lysidine(34) synthetase TilS [Nocardia seriolae]MTJ66621.1 tRNA lysidine(34) synthetase TilS [Nocardia seriolae]MTJ71949.1 tRNA lysidine(34) synthetase TilS [Nocardia seriolae]MTJ84750.1 tRNA lysidine(34) synthetase TilS [Nocardia seriolae]MTK28738.1 tRNA lysidine(34) synthetase TilS [Nocardia seriolae]MTK38342.1 tRNA lysidine(34) synthetase TilS [Nocardia seriolae]